VGEPGRRTTLWSWDAEHALWLRNVTVERRELPPLDRRPELTVGRPFDLLEVARAQGPPSRDRLRPR
jgi:hypothetical protein